jgi:hypothetical protein
MDEEKTTESTFDKAFGGWYDDPSRPDPTGVCYMFRLDKAVTMYVLSRLLVTRWGAKSAYTCTDTVADSATSLEDREARLRFRMKRAKKITDRVHMSRESFSKIELYWQSIACYWMMKLAQTCRWWNARVKTYRTSVGPGYLHVDEIARDRMLVAEQKFRVRMRVQGLQSEAHEMRIHIATHLIPTALECEAMTGGTALMRMYGMSEKIGHYTLMDVWNHGGKASLRKLVKILRSVIEKRCIGYNCVIGDELLPVDKTLPLHAKTFKIVLALKLKQRKQQMYACQR